VLRSFRVANPGGGILWQPFRLVPGRADEPSVYVVGRDLAEWP